VKGKMVLDKELIDACARMNERTPSQMYGIHCATPDSAISPSGPYRWPRACLARRVVFVFRLLARSSMRDKRPSDAGAASGAMHV
jgi:hypothetical protein